MGCNLNLQSRPPLLTYKLHVRIIRTEGRVYVYSNGYSTEEDGTSTCSRAYYVNKVCVVCN